MRYLVTGELAQISTLRLSIRRHCGFMVRHLTPRKLANILLCLWEMKLRRATLRSHPFYLRVEASSICNLRCPGCQLGRGETERQGTEQRKPGLMSLRSFKESVRDFLPYLVKVNLYDEGEPLLNPELFAMIRHLSDNNVSTCISSNFSLPLSNGDLLRLIDSGLEHLVIALDGATPESYNRYRVGGDFFQVLENMRRLSALMTPRDRKRLKVELQYIDFDDDAREREALSRLARGLGIWRFSVVQGSSREGWPRFSGSEEERRRRGCYQLWVTATINSSGAVGACDYGEDNGMSYLGEARNYFAEGMRNHPSAVGLRRSFGDGLSLNGVCRHCNLYANDIR
jgi:wyosine [tRNA(Phe)-imidazoG37] synthetase (radical SAM superfamily)